MFNEYAINGEQRFREDLFPAIEKEVTDLYVALLNIREIYKIEIVISFLRYHSLKIEWLRGNKEVAKMLTSGSLAISNLESLFISCRNNAQFTDDLESYIKLKFLNGTGFGRAGQTLHSP